MFFKFSFVVTAHVSSSRKGKFTLKLVLFLAEFCWDPHICNYSIIFILLPVLQYFVFPNNRLCAILPGSCHIQRTLIQLQNFC